MVKSTDIIDEILEALPELLPDYEDWKETYDENDHNLNTKLECLAAALVRFREKDPTDKKIWETSLNLMEKHLEKCPKDELKRYEVMFFEDILNVFSHIADEEEKRQAHALLEENSGPISRELCRQNNEFWGIKDPCSKE